MDDHSVFPHPHFGDMRFTSTAEWCGQFISPPPARSIVLATDERTGSEWLCQMLGATEKLGRPSEFLNEHWMRRFLPDYPSDAESQVRIAHLAGTTLNGVFAMKLHPWHFWKITEASLKLSDVFPAAIYVRLYREDLLGQAISLVRAQQTESFHSVSSDAAPAVFDSERIERTMKELAWNRQRWDRFFARNEL